MSLQDIILDLAILHGPHPVQACYVGLEHIKSQHNSNRAEIQIPQLKSRYGLYQLLFFDRHGNVGFLNKANETETLIPIEKVVFFESFIGEFDAIEAFYIGILAGIQINNAKKISSGKSLHDFKQLKLTVIKGSKNDG